MSYADLGAALDMSRDQAWRVATEQAPFEVGHLLMLGEALIEKILIIIGRRLSEESRRRVIAGLKEV